MDVSLSMTRPVSLDGSEEFQRKNLAVHGLNMLFEHMASNYRLEFTALMAFSSLWELLVPFTRDYNSLQVMCILYIKIPITLFSLIRYVSCAFFFFCSGGFEQPRGLWQDLSGIGPARSQQCCTAGMGQCLSLPGILSHCVWNPTFWNVFDWINRVCRHTPRQIDSIFNSMFMHLLPPPCRWCWLRMALWELAKVLYVTPCKPWSIAGRTRSFRYRSLSLVNCSSCVLLMQRRYWFTRLTIIQTHQSGRVEHQSAATSCLCCASVTGVRCHG